MNKLEALSMVASLETTEQMRHILQVPKATPVKTCLLYCGIVALNNLLLAAKTKNAKQQVEQLQLTEVSIHVYLKLQLFVSKKNMFSDLTRYGESSVQIVTDYSNSLDKVTVQQLLNCDPDIDITSVILYEQFAEATVNFVVTKCTTIANMFHFVSYFTLLNYALLGHLQSNKCTFRSN